MGEFRKAGMQRLKRKEEPARVRGLGTIDERFRALCEKESTARKSL
jgi:hypothetical protein